MPESSDTGPAPEPPSPPHRRPPPPPQAFAALDHTQLVHRYRAGVNQFHPSLLAVPDDALDTYWRPDADVGRWSVRVLIGHLADCEIVFAHRLRRIVAEERPIIGAFDSDAFIDAGLYHGPAHPVAGFLAVIAATRNWCGEWLGNLEPIAFDRGALHPERGEITMRTVLDYATWHLEHHAYFLAGKLRKLDPSTTEHNSAQTSRPTDH